MGSALGHCGLMAGECPPKMPSQKPESLRNPVNPQPSPQQINRKDEKKTRSKSRSQLHKSAIVSSPLWEGRDWEVGWVQNKEMGGLSGICSR